MLPVSGAEQLQASGAINDRPMISHNGAYSRFVRPRPYSLSGKNRFHKPVARAFAFNSSMIGGIVQRPRWLSCSVYVFSFGTTFSWRNAVSLACRSLTLGEYSKI